MQSKRFPTQLDGDRRIFRFTPTSIAFSIPLSQNRYFQGVHHPQVIAELEVVRRSRVLALQKHPFYGNRIDMDTVTLSSKFQVVIPLAIREALRLTSGEKLRVIRYFADRVEFIPVRKIQQMRGFLKGMDTTIRVRMNACERRQCC